MNGYLDVAVATNCHLTFPGSSRSDPWVSHSNPLLACGVAARVSLTQFGWRRVGWARPSLDGWSRGFHGRRAHCIQSDPVGGSRSRVGIRGCGRLVSRLCRHLWVLIRGELPPNAEAIWKFQLVFECTSLKIRQAVGSSVPGAGGLPVLDQLFSRRNRSATECKGSALLGVVQSRDLKRYFHFSWCLTRFRREEPVVLSVYKHNYTIPTS